MFFLLRFVVLVSFAASVPVGHCAELIVMINTTNIGAALLSEQ